MLCDSVFLSKLVNILHIIHITRVFLIDGILDEIHVSLIWQQRQGDEKNLNAFASIDYIKYLNQWC